MPATPGSVARSVARVAALAAAGTAAALSGAGALRAAFHRPVATTTPGESQPHSPSSSVRPRPVRELGERLLRLTAHPTIALADHEQTDAAPFHALQQTMAELYPLVHDSLRIERVGSRGLGLLLRWPGTDPELASEPLLLMAHQDVVPVTGQEWAADPFTGTLSGDPLRVRARGTLDDKGMLLTILEATESLIGSGFRPARDIYLFLGDNEEVAGNTAVEVAALLRERGITPWLVLDEGGAVVEPGVLPGVRRSAAMIGVAEKGILTVRLTARQQGGHSSTPPRNAATVRIARAVLALEKHQFPLALPEPTVRMMEELGRHAPFGSRLLYANVGPLSRPVAALLAKLSPETAAMARTTIATTQLAGSPANNVLATSASATVNLRLAVGTTSSEALDHIRSVVGRDLEVEVLELSEPSPVSPSSGDRWDLLTRTVREVFPDAACAPYVQNGATDSRHFSRNCPHVYRFAPLRMSDDDRARLHAADESVAADTLAEGVAFMAALIRGASA